MNILAYDLDGTLIEADGSPIAEKINRLNSEFENGNNFIVIYTARSYNIFHETRKILLDLGIKHHALVMEKIRATCYIDDKARVP